MKNKETVLITGASSGIGKAFAELFAKQHNDLILVARNQAALDTLAKQLKENYKINATVINKDLAKPDAAESLMDDITKQNLNVTTLINNAGFGYKAAFHEMDTTIINDMLNVNIVTLTKLARLVLPQMITRGSGRILNMCSTSAFQPGPLMATYFASKAYVLSWSRALSEEVRGTGVMVKAICPGPTLTNFAKHARLEGNPIHSGFPPATTAEAVAEEGYRLLQKDKHVRIVGSINRILSYVSMLTPTPLVMRTLHKIHSK